MSYSPSKKSRKVGESNAEVDKIQKRNLLEQKRRIKPGECHKVSFILFPLIFICFKVSSK